MTLDASYVTIQVVFNDCGRSEVPGDYQFA